MTRPNRLRRLFLAAFVAGMALPTFAYGGSGAQARAVIDGLDADVVTRSSP